MHHVLHIDQAAQPGTHNAHRVQFGLQCFALRDDIEVAGLIGQGREGLAVAAPTM